MTERGTFGSIKHYGKTYGVPIATLITGVLGEGYANDHGYSLSDVITNAFSNTMQKAGPAVGDLLDKLGKSTVHIATTYPAETLLGTLGLIGTLYIANERDIIKIRNPITRGDTQ